MKSLPDTPFRRSADELASQLDVDIHTGLSAQEATRRLKESGPNELQEHKKTSLWNVLFAQFASLVVYLLIGAAAVAFILGETVEGIAILAVIALNAAIGFFMEFQAIRSMEALRQLATVRARVRRDGRTKEIPAAEIVPGDILLCEAGDIIAADARVAESAQLEADESTLTGESVPVAKTTDALPEVNDLADQLNMLFKGTSITRGNGVAIVVRTGMQTELGKISELVESAEQEATPLEEKLEGFSRKLVWLTLVLAVAVVVVGILQGKDVFLVIETAIALAVAAIPEGLPIVATIALARGMLRMARRNVIVRRLASVETLGGTNVICTDKTGTLTENRLTVSRIALPEGTVEAEWKEQEQEMAITGDGVDSETFKRLLRVMVLCNNAEYHEKGKHSTGDPLEIALLKFAFAASDETFGLREQFRRVEEEPFDPTTKIMVTVHEADNGQIVAAKGAAEAILDRCSTISSNGKEQDFDEQTKKQWMETFDELATDGLRVLAFADGTTNAGSEKTNNLVFLGLVGFLDPPREDVRPALKECADAGITVIMVTGDHPATARAIAKKVGLIGETDNDSVLRGDLLEDIDSLSDADRREILETRVFARVTPQQKLGLIAVYQQNGDIVGMTGDGVNDAPALKKADIGIAMGKQGTQIAREAATMILEDDAFSSIVEAVRQGRIIFGNIRQFVIFLLSCNISEIFVVAGSTFIGLPLPLLPLQILFLNLVTDVFPALALGMGSGNDSVMKEQPRNPKEPILTRALWTSIGAYGAAITISVLGVALYCDRWLGLDKEVTNNVTFLSLTLAQLWHVFNITSARHSFIRNDITRNVYVWLALLVCIGIVAIAYLVEPFHTVLSLTHLSFEYWEIILIGSLLPVLIIQLLKRLKLVW